MTRVKETITILNPKWTSISK